MTDTKNINYGQYIVPEAIECINLGIGQPNNKLLPLEDFNESLYTLQTKNNYSLLQYGKIEGYDEFRSTLANFLTENYKFKVNKDEIIITNGITGALSLLLSLFKTKKTKIICEDPTYFLALNIFKDFNFDDNDIIKINLNKKNIFDEIEIETDITYLMYLIPFNQNPSGNTYTKKDIDNLIFLLNLHSNIIVFSDEVYNFLNFNGELNIPLYKYHNNIISLNSFSKIYAPALRLGWLSCSEFYLNKIKTCGQLDSSGCVNPISTALMDNLILVGSLKKSINKWRIILKENCQSLFNLLNEYLKEYITDIYIPNGGYFLWIKFKYNMKELSNNMEKYKIKFHNGSKFSTDNDAKYYIRLSFSWYELSEYNIFVERLKIMLDDYKKKMTPNIYILGYNGKMGRLIVDEIIKDEHLLFKEGLIKNFDLKNICENDNVNKYIIDVSSVEGTTYLLNNLIKYNVNIPLIIGTTGNLPMDLIRQYAMKNIVFLCSNFSFGISQFKKIINCIDKNVWMPSLTEKHHIHKKDKPSGTALTLMNEYNKHNNTNNIYIDDIISIREGEIIGHHELLLTNGDETIKIIHTANSRKIFASGCVKLIHSINNNLFDYGIYDYEFNKL